MAFFMYRQLQSCHHHHCHLPARKALVSLSVRALPLVLKFCRNSLQEEHRPVIHPATLSRVKELLWFSLQLFLLNEAAVVLVNDGESLLDVIRRLGGQADLGEESLVVEGGQQLHVERGERKHVSMSFDQNLKVKISPALLLLSVHQSKVSSCYLTAIKYILE